jgi:uncharacterized membrane protein YfcA
MQAAAIFLPMSLAADVLTVWTYRKDWSAWNLAVLLPSTAAGIALGWFMASMLTAAHIRFAVGVIAGLFVLRHWLGTMFEQLTPRPNITTGIVFGTIGGFATMLANAGGPAWQMHILPQRLEKLCYVGTVTMLFAASNIFKVPALANLGVLTVQNMTAGAALLPIALGASYAGIWLVRRTRPELFFRIAYALMFLIAIELIRGSIVEIWG